MVAAAALALEGVLRDDAVDARDAAAVEPAVAAEHDLLLPDLEVAVGGAGIDRALAVAAAELGDDAGPHRARALVVHVGIHLAQHFPHGGQARVQEAQHRDAGALAERLVHGDAVDEDRTRLAVVEGNHRDAVAVVGQQARERALLDLGAADDLDVRIPRQHRPGIGRDEADVRLASRR